MSARMFSSQYHLRSILPGALIGTFLSVGASVTFAQDTTTKVATATATTSQPKNNGRNSWTSDKRELQVGDIVTVFVDEYTLSSLDKRVDATDNRRRDMTATVSTPSSGQAVGIGTTNNASSQTRGTDARTNRIATEMSARVVEVGQNGTIRLEGTKTLNVEKSKITFALSGWARTQDLSAYNAINSSRLADAKIEYQAEGPLGSPKGGIIGRLLGKLWP